MPRSDKGMSYCDMDVYNIHQFVRFCSRAQVRKIVANHWSGWLLLSRQRETLLMFRRRFLKTF